MLNYITLHLAVPAQCLDPYKRRRSSSSLWHTVS